MALYCGVSPLLGFLSFFPHIAISLVIAGLYPLNNLTRAITKCKRVFFFLFTVLTSANQEEDCQPSYVIIKAKSFPRSWKSGNLIGTAKQLHTFLKGWALIGIQWSFRLMLKRSQEEDFVLSEISCAAFPNQSWKIYNLLWTYPYFTDAISLWVSLFLLFEVKPFSTVVKVFHVLYEESMWIQITVRSVNFTVDLTDLKALLLRFKGVRYHAIILLYASYKMWYALWKRIHWLNFKKVREQFGCIF